MKSAMDVFEDDVREEYSIEIAKEMLANGDPIDYAIKYTHLPEEKAIELLNDLKLE